MTNLSIDLCSFECFVFFLQWLLLQRLELFLNVAACWQRIASDHLLVVLVSCVRSVLRGKVVGDSSEPQGSSVVPRAGELPSPLLGATERL